jgi:DNA-directed RNA polymerase specialized sigma24 family protein
MTRRRWALSEIQEVRRLRDVDGLPFIEIGDLLGVSEDKCRSVYHCARTQDQQPSGRSIQRKYGISQYQFQEAKDVMGRGTPPVRVAEAILGYKIEESK